MSWDTIIIGSGISGSFYANSLTQNGLKVLIIESGKAYTPHTYPRHELHSNSEMYWNGGVEINKSADLAILRPKVLGGGSVINGGLLDRFDNLAWKYFEEASQISDFNSTSMNPYYDQAESEIHLQKIPESFANGNAKVFRKGFQNLGYQYATLTRAQKNCKYNEGNDCIECLGGCPIGSKQSMLDSALGNALKNGAQIYTQFTVEHIEHTASGVHVHGVNGQGHHESFFAPKVVLAAGSIGNTKILQSSNIKNQSIGHNFYNHPQWMVLARYQEPINGFQGPLQSYKSDDINFRKKGFKLENVFAGPVAISMLIPNVGKNHQDWMSNLAHIACIEVCIRDTSPGTIRFNSQGQVLIDKNLNQDDLAKKTEGINTIKSIFHSTGCQEISVGDMSISLHLMGGCAIGENATKSVVSPDFHLHDYPNLYCSDSSIFPAAPGINPSLTIMALSIKGSQSLLRNYS